MISTIKYQENFISVLNQTLLPHTVEYKKCFSPEEVADAIINLEVRGAPLIGVTAAYGIVLAVSLYSPATGESLPDYYRRYDNMFRNTRPTAVNLFWALDKMQTMFVQHQNLPLAQLKLLLKASADRMFDEDVTKNRRLGNYGAGLFPENSVSVMTICNAGELATCGHGTALGVIRSLANNSQLEQVWACETRPVLQGARLTVWELMKDNIPVKLITDSMAAQVMKSYPIDAIIVGADRVAANGDTANKIGTLGLAIMANFFDIPFYIAAPLSSFDLDINNGEGIPIETRDAHEVRNLYGQLITVDDVPVYNPAFDVTDNSLITAFITESGIIYPDFNDNITKVIKYGMGS